MNIRLVVFALGAISILSSSQATSFSKTQHLIDEICHKTDNNRFCNRVFNDNLVPSRQHHHGLHGLARIALEQGTLHAVFTSLNISKSLSSSEMSKKSAMYKNYLKDCLDGYEYVKSAYRTAFGCFEKGIYEAEYDEMKAAWRVEQAKCEGYGRPHMLVHSNWEMRLLISMTMATAHELARAEPIQQFS